MHMDWMCIQNNLGDVVVSIICQVWLWFLQLKPWLLVIVSNLYMDRRGYIVVIKVSSPKLTHTLPNR